MKDWKEYKMEEIANIIGGGTPSTTNAQYWDGNIPWITPADLSKNKTKYFKNGERNISELGLKQSSARMLPKGTVLLSSRAPIGYLAIANNSLCTNQGFKSLICKEELVLNEYLYYYLILQKDFLETISSGATFPELSGGTLKKQKIFLPPLPTQTRIAAILSAYDDLIEVNNQRIKLLEETARELYKEWFVRMRFPNYQDAKFVKGVPEGYGELTYFKDFIKLNRGFDLPEHQIKEGDYPVIASTSIKAYHHQYKVKAPIITTGRSGSLGTILYVNQDGWPLNTSLYVKDFKGNDPIYVYYTMKNIDFESFNSGAGVPTLNQNHLHKLKLWIADKNLQTKFKKIVYPIFQQIETLQQQNTHLQQVRDRLLPRLISGKLQV